MSGDRASFEPLPTARWRAFRAPHASALAQLQEEEGYHRLDIEDCLHKREIAKVVDRGSYAFVVAKIIRCDAAARLVAFDDLDLFVKRDSLVTVEEHAGPFVKQVAAQLEAGASAHRIGTIELVRAILDALMDGYLEALDAIGEQVGAMESRILRDQSPGMLERIFGTKRVLIEFRRNAAGMREVIGALTRHPFVASDAAAAVYFRDLYEDAVRVIEFIETYRDVLNGLFDIHLSSVANRTNDIVKVLTVYGVVALPLLVIPGLYGMNVALPFQKAPGAFAFLVALIAACMVLILLMLKRRGWF